MQPVIIPRSEHSLSRKWISRNALRVLYRLKEKGYYAYLVGGGVRDLLLGREPKDFDIATDARPHEIKKIFRNCRLIGRRFRLAHIHFLNEIIEVATFRAPASEEQEIKASWGNAEQIFPSAMQPTSEGAGPDVRALQPAQKPRPPRLLKTEDGMILRDNIFGTPEEDALRRDFTVNALFYNIGDFSVIDYAGGMRDLRSGLIRIIGDPVVRFTEDPVRMVRAVRFAAMLGFEIEKNTYQAIIDLKDRVALASPFRMYEEVLKLFLMGEGEKTYQLLRRTGIFGVLFPRLNEWVDSESDGFPHTWIGKALEWVDACVLAGRQVPPHILFSLMFGQFIEEKVAELRKAGASALDSVIRAVNEFLSEEAQRVMVPKKVGYPMRDIYWNQYRFEKTAGRHPLYFLRRPGFSDAFEYLRFSSEVTGERKDLCIWWKGFIKNHPLPPDDEKEIQRRHEKRTKPAKRRSRRRRKGRREASKSRP
jgi:poly(A) polymerase